LFVALMAGCGAFVTVPDQTVFPSLETLAASGQAVVRLYGRPIAGIEQLAIHSWFLVKRADSTSFDRWELHIAPREPYGHVWKNVIPPDEFGPGTFVIADRIGDDALPVIDFIETASPAYDCMNVYAVFGPNSNTYIQWVLTSTGWNVALPPASIGKDTAPVCN
jgi:hypothetical protein